MCGISGYYSFSGAIGHERAEAVCRLTSLLAHRGLDDCGLFQDGGAILGHRRLSILDLSSDGQQPMCNEDSTVWVTFNGEIYNYLELRRDLADAGHRFRSRTDTEVLVHGYEEWGIEKLLEKLRGMFAFALYDSPKRQMILARDRFGIKPLYYTEGPGQDGVAFASETKALVASGLASSEIDRRALAGYLLFGSIPAPSTVRRRIRCLLPAHYLVLTRDGAGEPRRYWNLEEGIAVERERLQRGSAASIAETLQEAVESHLVSDAPLGVFLSGGMDSSAIAAIASRAYAGPLKTVTISFSESAYSEASEARATAQALGADHCELQVTGADFLAELPSFLAAMDQPTHDGVNSYFVSKAARQAGLKVVLSGLGGDEVFWGYRHYSWLEGRAPWLRILAGLPNPLRQAALAGSALYGWTTRQERWRRLVHLREQRGIGGIYFLTRGFFPATEVERLLGASRSELRGLVEETLAGGAAPAVSARMDGAAFSHLEMKLYLHDQLLRDADVFSMAHGVETRIPFLDHDLVCRVAALPAALKRANGVNKPALLRAVPHPAVAAAAARKKAGFLFPIGLWLKDYLEPMREMALHSTALDSRETAGLFRSFAAGHLHWSRAWAMVVLGATLRA